MDFYGSHNHVFAYYPPRAALSRASA